MRQAVRLGVEIDREVVRVAAGVGLVVAHADVAAGLEMPPDVQRDARILVPHDADVPRPYDPVEFRRAGVHGDQGGHDAALLEGFEAIADRVVIGLEETADAQGLVGLAEVHVARNRDAVADFRNGAGVVRLAVRIHDQPRKAGQHGLRVEFVGQCPDQFVDADVPGDVPLEHPVGQAELVQGGREIRAGVVGHEENRRRAVIVVAHPRRRVAGSDQRAVRIDLRECLEVRVAWKAGSAQEASVAPLTAASRALQTVFSTLMRP
ncbi:MAG: hypothetical protein P8Y54_04165 [Xanthomonadales bacterium]